MAAPTVSAAVPLDALRSLATELVATSPLPGWSLDAGTSGMALAAALAAGVLKDRQLADAAVELLALASREALDEAPGTGPGLFAGLTGVAAAQLMVGRMV